MKGNISEKTRQQQTSPKPQTKRRSEMDVQGGQMVVNPTFDDCTSRPMTYCVENTDSTGTKADRQVQQDSQGNADCGKMKPTGRSNRSVLMLMSIVCFLFFVIIVLIVLMSVGKIMKNCGCSSSEG